MTRVTAKLMGDPDPNRFERSEEIKALCPIKVIKPRGVHNGSRQRRNEDGQFEGLVS